ncbi:MAG: hypothetical protein KKE73_10950 [Proteobacteria bacterium]|nr:hypothetical protein [Pseudomonadota bacterium]
MTNDWTKALEEATAAPRSDADVEAAIEAEVQRRVKAFELPDLPTEDQIRELLEKGKQRVNVQGLDPALAREVAARISTARGGNISKHQRRGLRICNGNGGRGR